MLTLTGLALISVFGLSSCNSTEKTGANQPGGGIAKSNTPAGATSPAAISNSQPPPNNGAPVAFVNLPQQVRDTKVETLEGESLKLSDYANKVVIVNIWATWCGPCRLEMPELVKMDSEYKSRGLVVLGLATKYNESNDPEHVKEFIRSQKVTYKIIWDDGTLAMPLVEAVGARSVIPQSFVISRDGRILKHFQGFSPLSTPQLMRAAVEEALNDKGKA
jgi:glutathione peroxidase-family protein